MSTTTKVDPVVVAKHRPTCECGDVRCPVRHASRCFKPAHVRLFRVDMHDRTGTWFCQGCADDATESGVFTDSRAGRLD